MASRGKDARGFAYASMNDVKANMTSTRYPPERIRYIQGRVEVTLPADAPEKICMLRLDTDWYESTQHELTQLYPRVVTYGVLIIVDYGHWQGARQAADEYFSQLTPVPFLHRFAHSPRPVIN